MGRVRGTGDEEEAHGAAHARGTAGERPLAWGEGEEEGPQPEEADVAVAGRWDEEDEAEEEPAERGSTKGT